MDQHLPFGLLSICLKLLLWQKLKIFVPDVLLGEDDPGGEYKMVARALKSWPLEVKNKTFPAGVGSSLYLWSISSAAAHDEHLFFIAHLWKMGWKVSVDCAASFRTARKASEVTLLLQPDVASTGDGALWMWDRAKSWSSRLLSTRACLPDKLCPAAEQSVLSLCQAVLRGPKTPGKHFKVLLKPLSMITSSPRHVSELLCSQFSSYQNGQQRSCSSRGEGCRFVPNREILTHCCALLPALLGYAPSAFLPRIAVICPQSCQLSKEMIPNKKRFQSCLAGNYYMWCC